jgi:hypothetical protein
MKQKLFLMTVALGAVTVLSGCWPFPSSEKIGQTIMEKAIESQTGGKVNIDAEKGTMNVDTKDGSFSAGENAKIPDNFPKDIFVFSDAKVIFAMNGVSGEKSYSIAYFSAVTPVEAMGKYKDEMTKIGWQKENEMDLGAQGKILNFKKDQARVMVTIGTSEDEENKGKTQIGVTTTEDMSASGASSGSQNVGGGAQE